MKVIGIAGRAGAGKNTVAGLLAAVLSDQGYSVALDSFAGAIKQQLREEFGWPGVKDTFWRRALQMRGAWARATKPEYWIHIIEDKWRAGAFGSSAAIVPDFLILTDVRYRNEAAWCAKRGVCWLVEGRGGLEGDAGKHASEMGLSAWRFRTVIQNHSKDLAPLAKTVAEIVEGGRHVQAPVGEDKTS